MLNRLNLLLVDESEMLFNSLSKSLANNAIQVAWEMDMQVAFDSISKKNFDLMVLDYGLMKLGGSSFLEELRVKGDKSYVLVLSDQNASKECLECLAAGADDFLSRPFAIDELTARIRSLSRYAFNSVQPKSTEAGVGLCLVPLEKDATFNKVFLQLTPTEFKVLEVFFNQNGNTVSHEKIIQELYGYDANLTRNSIEVHISALRRKLKALGAPPILKTRRGFGYFMENL